MDFLNNPNWLAIGFVALCVLPFFIIAIMAAAVWIFGRRFLANFLNPDISGIHRYYESQRARSPRATTEQLIAQVIRRQAFRSGVVGAITGLGGLVTLPVALPVDAVLSLRMQAGLVDFIAQLYGYSQLNDVESRVRTYLIMSGSGRLSDAAIEVVLKYALRLMGKSFSKLIPVVGAVVSFAVNYAIVSAIGRVALRYYSSQPRLQPGQP